MRSLAAIGGDLNPEHSSGIVCLHTICTVLLMNTLLHRTLAVAGTRNES